MPNTPPRWTKDALPKESEMKARQEYEIITFDEFKSRKDGGGYLLYWNETNKYYFGRAAVYERRHHEGTVDRDDIYLNRHWKKYGPPDVVVVVPLEKSLCESFEKAWLDIFRGGSLYDKSVCMNTSSRADCSFDCMTIEQRSAAGRHRGELTQKYGTGIFGLTPEQRSEYGKLGYKNSIGKFTNEQRMEIGNKKLTQSQVHEIRHLLALGDVSQVEIAEHYPVVQTAISHIKLGHTYADW